MISSWQSGQHGASLHQGEAGRGVSIYLTDAHPDPQRRGHQYSYPGGFAGSHGGRPVRQQGPGVAVWKVSGTAGDVTRKRFLVVSDYQSLTIVFLSLADLGILTKYAINQESLL